MVVGSHSQFSLDFAAQPDNLQRRPCHLPVHGRLASEPETGQSGPSPLREVKLAWRGPLPTPGSRGAFRVVGVPLLHQQSHGP